MTQPRILVIGAFGQIGRNLTVALNKKFKQDNVLIADIHAKCPDELSGNKYIRLNVLDTEQLKAVLLQHKIDQVYLLADLPFAENTHQKDTSWQLNVHALIGVLELAHKLRLDKVFWPSSIAVFGPDSPKYHCSQYARIEPLTAYGISKRAGEYWCNYYAEKYGVDVRSLRYPGLMSHNFTSGRCATDYAAEMFNAAVEGRRYDCYLSEDNCLPMMYMDDAIEATIQLMEAPKDQITTRLSYNVAAVSFAPCDLAAIIRKYLPGFKVNYQPDRRDVIAKSWPSSINDQQARTDWGWRYQFDLDKIAREMVVKLAAKKKIELRTDTIAQLAYPDFPMDNYVYSTRHI
jgi:nucleoside-diphosphate-sugar epimerase